jgi:hypothetical protein
VSARRGRDASREWPAPAFPRILVLVTPLETLRTHLADRYRIERELGRGGMATVYLAHDLRHDRPVALKVLHPELGLSLGVERFQREIRLAARLQHPHILTVHDSGEIAGEGSGPAVLWFTMPFIEGETLRSRLTRERQLPIPDALRMTAATNLLLLGDRTAAADTLALMLADSNVFFLTRPAVAVDPFWLKLKGVWSFEDAVGR